jgi:hypothetical protein
MNIHHEIMQQKRFENLAYIALSNSILKLKQAINNDKSFEYLAYIKGGPALFLGEGNLSFTLSLASRVAKSSSNITSTTYETYRELSKEALANAGALRKRKAKVLHGVDATNLNSHFRTQTFNLIAFQFPNVASRIPLHGRNANHILIRRFLQSARGRLRFGGRVAITVVNSPYYDGAFDMAGASKYAKFKPPIAHPFHFGEHPGYSHVNTKDETESAIDRDDNFVTLEFKPE